MPLSSGDELGPPEIVALIGNPHKFDPASDDRLKELADAIRDSKHKRPEVDRRAIPKHIPGKGPW
jgi:hypothetical protein